MMTATERGFRIYQEYNAINLHFDRQTNYDAFAYNFKTNAKMETYERKPERIFFEILAKHYDPRSFIAYNRATRGWIGIKNLVRDPSYKKTYEETARYIQSLSYMLSNRMVHFGTSLRELLEVTDNRHPLLIRLYLAKTITLVDMVVLDQLYNYVPYFDQNIAEQVYWPDLSFLIKKFSPFVPVDHDRIKPLFQKQLQLENGPGTGLDADRTAI